MSAGTRTTTAVPRLLVSVRSVDELTAALAGGADIVDVKEPRAGSLGRAGADVVAAIATRLAVTSPSTPLSVALGELVDWRGGDAAALPAQVRWAKLGLSGCGADPAWRAQWLRLRAAVDAASGQALEWIAVAYADACVAQAPTPEHVAAAAVETGCAGLLLDTYTKSGRTAFDWQSADAISKLAEFVRGRGLRFALAGGLRREDVPVVRAVAPDIVAIRSAACRGGERTQPVDAGAVREFRAALAAQARIS